MSMNFLGLDGSGWQALFAALMFLSGVVNTGLVGFMWRMRATFVLRSDFEANFNAVRKENETAFVAVRRENDVRFESMERSIAAFDARMRHVETDSASAASEIGAAKDAVMRVERLTMLLVEFRFKEAAANDKA